MPDTTRQPMAVVVNDDITQLCLLAGILERRGMLVRSFTNAHDALAGMAEFVPGIIVTDIQMPGMDGWHFCRMLRSREYASLNRVPILAVSAVFDDESADRLSRQIGADGFVTLPVDAAGLMERVESLLSGERSSRKAAVVLVIRDETEARVLSEAFSADGFTVFVARGCSDASAIVQAHAPEVIVADPGESGCLDQQHIGRIRELNPQAVVLVMVDGSNPLLATEALRRGADACISRPYDPAFVALLAEKRVRERVFAHGEELLNKRAWELAESRERYERMMASMIDPVYISSAEFRIEYMNAAAHKAFGECEVRAHCYTAVFGLHSVCPWCRMLDVQAGSLARFSVGADTMPRSFQASVAPLRHPDGSVSHMCILRDTTEERMLTARLQQTGKLDAVGQLARGIAHDFNNMLGAILGYADIVRETNLLSNGKPVDEQLNKRMQAIVAAGHRASALVGQLLAFSRQGKYRNDPLNIDDCVRAAVSLLERSLDKRVRIETQLRAGDNVVMGDAGQIQSALVALAINARDAMSSGGLLRLESRVESVGAAQAATWEVTPGEYVAVRVIDSGGGIEPAILGRIFDPYFTTKEAASSSGLGLPSAYGTVMAHNGHIEVSSTVGKGSVFTLHLPVGRRTGTGEAATGSGAGDDVRHALLVDDEESARELGREMLHQLGYRATVLATAREGLEFYRAHWRNTDVVVLDMILPDHTGLECFDRMCQINPRARGIIVTGYGLDSSTRNSLNPGVVAVVPKPFTTADLSEALRLAFVESIGASCATGRENP